MQGSRYKKVVRGHKGRKQLLELIEDIRQKMLDKVNQVEQRAYRIKKAAATLQGATKKTSTYKIETNKINEGKEITERMK
jgi:hypothetical protein